MSLLMFILVLTVLVGVHELGHLIVAKWCGVHVKTFSLGFGPTLLKRQVGSTVYKVSAIPLGGYVSLAGENPNAEEDATIPKDQLLTSKRPWQKLLIVLAGPFMNVVYAFLMMPFVFMLGAPQVANLDPATTAIDHISVESVPAGSPASSSGIKPGDIFVSFDDKILSNYQQMMDYIDHKVSQTVKIVVKRNDQLVTCFVHINPSPSNSKDGLIGVFLKFNVEYPKFGFWESLKRGLVSTVDLTVMMFKGFASLFDGSIPVKEAVGGPIAIASMAGSAAKVGLSTLIFFSILLSINLAIMNMLPILPLDGGHALFFALEMVGITISLKIKNALSALGIALLLALMLFATGNDISKLFDKR